MESFLQVSRKKSRPVFHCDAEQVDYDYETKAQYYNIPIQLGTETALLRCGYQRTVQVEGPGQFARRGGILDFFSPAEPEPVRVEFWGDEIDSMGRFDVSSQRRTEQIQRCIDGEIKDGKITYDIDGVTYSNDYE